MSHVNIAKQHPAAYRAMVELDAAAETAAVEAGLDAELIELVKIRTSQINGCAYCLRMHSQAAVKHGETADRLAIVAAWWESQYFSDAERAALLLAEQITRISDGALVPDRGIVVKDALTESQIAAVAWLATASNSWNRIAVFSHYPVAP